MVRFPGLKRAALAAILGVSLSATTIAKEIDAGPNAPVVQVALLLDTSNSMDGMINQARTQLWKIVNQFNDARQDGIQPKIQVALYEYGNNGLDASGGYIRQVLPLTTDLDLVSEKLWALKTNGGDEYCGQVISKAVADLEWSRSKRAYEAIFIAGNEPFSQGSYDYHRACAEAIGKGIVINTIHCGTENVGRDTGWADGAKIGEGKFLNIDQDCAVVVIKAPQDDDLAKLSAEVNKTYVPYGAAGGEGKARQDAQTVNAATPSAQAERSYSVANASYKNSKWDLVDAVKDKEVDLKKLGDDALPEEMKKMSADERQKYVDGLIKQREEIQKKITELYSARAKYIAEEEKKQASATGTDTLDTAVLKAVREQLSTKEFKVN